MLARRATTALLTLVGLSTSGASARAQMAGAPIERDSAGIRIVQNASRRQAPIVFSLGATPLIDLGGPDVSPEGAFEPQQGYLRGVRLSDGGLAVIDVDRVHFFASKSTRSRVTVRTRSASRLPAFQYLMAVCATQGDTVVVADGHWRRVAVLSAGGTLVGSFPSEAIGSAPFNFCFGDGSIVLQRIVSDDRTHPVQLRLTRARTDGAVMNVIGEFTVPGIDFVTMHEPAIAAWGDLLYFGDGTRSEIQVYGTDGVLRRLLRTNDAPVPITPDEVARRLEATIPLGTSPAERAAELRRLHAQPHAATWPAYGRIHVDPLGRLWVEDYRMTNAVPTGWSAFDADGRLIGRMEMPAPLPGHRPLEVLGFGMNDILVRRKGTDGSARLVIYPLHRVGAGLDGERRPPQR